MKTGWDFVQAHINLLHDFKHKSNYDWWLMTKIAKHSDKSLKRYIFWSKTNWSYTFSKCISWQISSNWLFQRNVDSDLERAQTSEHCYTKSSPWARRRQNICHKLNTQKSIEWKIIKIYCVNDGSFLLIKHCILWGGMFYISYSTLICSDQPPISPHFHLSDPRRLLKRDKYCNQKFIYDKQSMFKGIPKLKTNFWPLKQMNILYNVFKNNFAFFFHHFFAFFNSEK